MDDLHTQIFNTVIPIWMQFFLIFPLKILYAKQELPEA